MNPADFRQSSSLRKSSSVFSCGCSLVWKMQSGTSMRAFDFLNVSILPPAKLPEASSLRARPEAWMNRTNCGRDGEVKIAFLVPTIAFECGERSPIWFSGTSRTRTRSIFARSVCSERPEWSSDPWTIVVHWRKTRQVKQRLENPPGPANWTRNSGNEIFRARILARSYLRWMPRTFDA